MTDDEIERRIRMAFNEPCAGIRSKVVGWYDDDEQQWTAQHRVTKEIGTGPRPATAHMRAKGISEDEIAEKLSDPLREVDP